MFSNVVAALCDPLTDSGDRQFWRVQSKEYQFDLIVVLSPYGYQPCVGAAAECRFECEAVTAVYSLTNQLDHQATRAHCVPLRLERAYARRDEVGIDKPRTVCLVRKEFRRKSCLAGSVWSGNNQNSFRRAHEPGRDLLLPWPNLPSVRRDRIGSAEP